MKSYNGKININFYNSKIPKEGLQFIYLSMILTDLSLEQVQIIILKCFYKNENMLLKEKRFLSILLMISDSNEESSDEETLLEKIQMEKNSDYEENSDEEILKKVQTGENPDEENQTFFSIQKMVHKYCQKHKQRLQNEAC